MQVGKVEKVGQQEVAVEAHEGAGVDGQGGDPGGGGEHEHGAAQRSVGQQGPRQGGPGGDCQFGENSGGAHRQPVLPAGEAPGFVDVGVGHRPHHQKGHAHRRHPAAETAGGEGVAEFVEHLDQGERHPVTQRAAPAEGVDQGGGEVVPLACDLEQAEGQRGEGDVQEGARIEHLDPRQLAHQPAIRAQERDAEEQIVVQQPLPERAVPGFFLLHEAGRAGLAEGADELMFGEEADHDFDVFLAQAQGGFGFDGLDDAGRVAEMPAGEHLEGRPVDTVELVADRVVEAPGRCAVVGGGAVEEGQFFAQRRQAERALGGQRGGIEGRGGGERCVHVRLRLTNPSPGAGSPADGAAPSRSGERARREP